MPRRRTLTAIAAALTTAAVLASAPSSPVETVLVPTLIGHLDRYPAEVGRMAGLKAPLEDVGKQGGPGGSGFISQKLDRFYQVWAIQGDENLQAGSIVAERDLETYEVLRTLVVPGLKVTPHDNSLVGTEWLGTLDEKNDRLYLQVAGVNPGSRGLTQAHTVIINNEDPAGIVSIDLKTFTHVVSRIPRGLAEIPFETLEQIFGIEYDEARDELILLVGAAYESPAGLAVNPVWLVGWPKSALEQGGVLPAAPPGLLGPRMLRNCRRDPINFVSGGRFLAPIMITHLPDEELGGEVRDYVFVPCFPNVQSENTILVRLNRETALDPKASDERAIPTPAGILNWAMDERHGRLVLLNNSVEEADAWVYEASTNAFIGIIELSPKGDLSAGELALGMDPITGRLYAYGSGNGVMVAEAAQDPVPQADIYPHLAKNAAIARIMIDSKRNTIFVVRGQQNGASWEDSYDVYRVPPPQPAAEDADSDDLTKQVAEEPGKTTREYGGNATAYGARVLLAGGLAGVPPSNGHKEGGKVYRDINARCGFRDREVAFGAIPQTTFGVGLAAAEALSVHLDGATMQDMERPSRCDLYNFYQSPNEVSVPGTDIKPTDLILALRFPSLFEKMDSIYTPPRDASSPTGARERWAHKVDREVGSRTMWQYRPATCARPTAEAGNNSDRFAAPTTVSCTTPNAISAVSRSRVHQSADLGPLSVSIGRTTSTTEVRLDEAKGLVATATSLVENIAIGPVTIGFVENKARSYARGRMGTAGTDAYQPVIGGLRGPGVSGCEIRCDINQAIPILNNALAGRVEFRAGKPEGRLQRGSPGGYEAAIIKGDKQRDSDNSLVGDKSREVAALELIVYNDNPSIGRVRQVIQFAGVRADSHYGIQLFDEGLPPCLECIPVDPFVPPVDDVLGDRFYSPPPPPPPPAQGGGSPVVKVVRGVVNGLRLLLANPREAGLMATAWGLLAAPFLVALRRRRLRDLSVLRAEP